MISENNDYGKEEVQRHFERKVMPRISVPGVECTEVPLEGLTQEEEHGILLEIVDDNNHELRNAPENVVICQARKSRFWNVFFRNNSYFSKQYLRVTFAGKGTAYDGCPFREFLRLAMNKVPKLSGFIFGKETEVLFTSNPAYIVKKYYSLGQLCVVAMLRLGRGPHCFYKSLVEVIFDENNVDDVEFANAALEEDVAQINSGNLDCLHNASINPSSNLEDAIKFYKLHFAILSRHVAINDFKSGSGSISEKVLNHYPVC